MRFLKIELGETSMTAASADNFFLRLRGLMGRSAKELGGLLISPCNQIHTCFMKEAIDVVYLDKEGVIRRIDRQVPPWKFLKAERGAARVLELSAGKAEELGLTPGAALKIMK